MVSPNKLAAQEVRKDGTGSVVEIMAWGRPCLQLTKPLDAFLRAFYGACCVLLVLLEGRRSLYGWPVNNRRVLKRPKLNLFLSWDEETDAKVLVWLETSQSWCRRILQLALMDASAESGDPKRGRALSPFVQRRSASATSPSLDAWWSFTPVNPLHAPLQQEPAGQRKGKNGVAIATQMTLPDMNLDRSSLRSTPVQT